MVASSFTKKLALWQKITIGVLLLLVIIYIYRSTRVEKFDTAQSSQDKTLTCTMFFTEWCGYCKKAKPEWERLSSELHGQNINGHQIVFRKIDCDKEPDLAKKYGIEGYPTFKFEVENRVVSYDGGNTYDEFKAFINKLIGN